MGYHGFGMRPEFNKREDQVAFKNWREASSKKGRKNIKDQPKLSPEDFLQFKKEQKLKSKKRRIRLAIALFLILSCVFSLGYFLITEK